MEMVKTDISSEVDAAFDEMECMADANRHGPHGGNVAALYERHGCEEGFLCRSHLEYYIHTVRPHNLRTIAELGYMYCELCNKVFTNIDDGEKVYPL